MFSLNVKLFLFFLIQFFFVSEISATMKEDYNKKKNMNQSCNLETAGFINEISIAGNYQYGEDKSPINYYEYYCILKDGTILNFYKSKSGAFDSKQKFKKGNLYETKLIDGKRFEYSIENNNLIEYYCKGYSKCIGEIQRKKLGGGILIKDD